MKYALLVAVVAAAAGDDKPGDKPDPGDDAKKCTDKQQDDTTNLDRVIQCSTIAPCFKDKKYSNDACTSKDESCGEWKKGESETLDGCILTKYCDVKANYMGTETTFTCPAGKKKGSLRMAASAAIAAFALAYSM